MNQIIGGFLKGLANVLGFFFDFLIAIVEVIVNLADGIRQIIAAILSFGCFFIFIFPGWIFATPFVLPLLLFALLAPFLGSQAVSFLKYGRYTVTEYLTDQGDYLISGKARTFDSMGGYSAKYQRMETERMRREQQERQRQQQEEWNRRFQNWYDQARNQQTGGYYGGGYYQQGGYQQSGPYYQDPTASFNKQYEESTRILGVPTTADKYEIKLAYRKKAKEYHPDLNKSPGATEMFQKINAAYEFLSDENIDRYKKMNTH